MSAAGQKNAPALVTRRFQCEDIVFDYDCAYRFLKIRKSSPEFSTLHALIARLYDQYKGNFQPSYRYRLCRIVDRDATSHSIGFEEEIDFSGEGVYQLLAGADIAAVFVLTVGEPVDRILEELSQRDFGESYFLDGIASTVTDGLLHLLKDELREVAGKQNKELLYRFAPGYTRWDLREQHKIFALLRAEEIGMRLSESYFMLPQKSLSGVFGLKPLAQKS